MRVRGLARAGRDCLGLPTFADSIFWLPVMRLYLALMMAVLLLAGCTKENGPQRLDFVNTTRFTSSSRTSLGVADTLASRVYAENTDASGPKLGRLVVTVHYTPKRDPFVYPTPVSAINRDLIDNNPEDFVYLDSTFLPNAQTGLYPDNFLFTNTFGVRTTTGSERWQYDLYNSSGGNPTASRAVKLSMRRLDSLAVYNDYTLKLVIPALGVPGDVRAKSTRRFLHLRAGLALPAYTVIRSGSPDPNTQGVAQKLTDLVILPDGLTIISPELFTNNKTIWPDSNRRKTVIYRSPNITASTFSSQLNDASIQAAFSNALAAAGTATGKTVGPVKTNEVYAFRTYEGANASPRYRYGLMLVLSVPTTTTTTTTAGLQLQVRMAK